MNVLNVWLIGYFWGFLSRASNTVPPPVRSRSPFCQALVMGYRLTALSSGAISELPPARRLGPRTAARVVLPHAVSWNYQQT